MRRGVAAALQPDLEPLHLPGRTPPLPPLPAPLLPRLRLRLWALLNPGRLEPTWGGVGQVWGAAALDQG